MTLCGRTSECFVSPPTLNLVLKWPPSLQLLELVKFSKNTIWSWRHTAFLFTQANSLELHKLYRSQQCKCTFLLLLKYFWQLSLRNVVSIYPTGSAWEGWVLTTLEYFHFFVLAKVVRRNVICFWASKD